LKKPTQSFYHNKEPKFPFHPIEENLRQTQDYFGELFPFHPIEENRRQTRGRSLTGFCFQKTKNLKRFKSLFEDTPPAMSVPSKKTLAVICAWQTMIVETNPLHHMFNCLLKDSVYVRSHSSTPGFGLVEEISSNANKFEDYLIYFSEMINFVDNGYIISSIINYTPISEELDVETRSKRFYENKKAWFTCFADTLVKNHTEVPSFIENLNNYDFDVEYTWSKVTEQSHTTAIWHSMPTDDYWENFKLRTSSYRLHDATFDDIELAFWTEVERLEKVPLLSIVANRSEMIGTSEVLDLSRLPYYRVKEQNIFHLPYLVLNLELNSHIIHSLAFCGFFNR
jgi:hypothetical protein